MKKSLVAVIFTLGQGSLALAAPVKLDSPDGSISVRIEQDASHFSVERRGEMVINPSPLGLELDGMPALKKLMLEKRENVKVKRSIPLVATKASVATDHYNGASLTFRELEGGKRKLFLDLRAYNEGIAFRYRMETTGPVSVRGERTAFNLAGNPSCFFTQAQAAHEESFEHLKVSQLPQNTHYDMPVLCATPSGKSAFAVTQAFLEGYTGASFVRDGDALRVQLSAVPNRAGAPFQSSSSLRTAWRVVMMGDKAGDLIASNLIGNLNPDAQGDFSWVKPGKAAWDWWSGPLEGMKPDMAAYRRFIDFAADAGFPYYLIDAGWAWGANNEGWRALPETDVTRAGQGIDMQALIQYAESKGVGLMLWVHWEHIAARMDEVLDTYARWGIKGVKVDFMNRDDQEVVNFYHRIAAATAKRHLLLDLHGAYVPAGLQRTYPNFITQEGVLGAEWNKMTPRITPEHNLILPYTRMLVGPMDYTPGGFRHTAPEQFKVQAVQPLTQTTRGQALAMYVVYDSPLQMVSDDPEAYRNAAGFDFIKQVPTAWDETRFLSGEPGRDIVLARRQGNRWYLGAMRAGEKIGQEYQTIKLNDLPSGRFHAQIWEDGSTPDTVTYRELDVTSKTELKLHVVPTGGAVVILKPRL